jgi:large subunit ribosomal protein L5
MESVLYTQYKKEIVPALKEELGYSNIMEVPRVEKIVLNVGYGKHVKDAAFIENVEKTLSLITGQKPVHNKAKKSISNFKIREGMDIGMSVTLRGKSMYDFLYKIIHLTLPRVRDFRGVTTKAMDRQGSYTLGLKEHLAFPEVVGNHAEKVHGLQIVIATTAKNQKEGMALFTKLGIPFKK